MRIKFSLFNMSTHVQYIKYFETDRELNVWMNEVCSTGGYHYPVCTCRIVITVEDTDE